MGWVWFEGSCPISLSVTQNNYWLAVEGNLEKKYRVRLKKYHTPLKLENEIKRNRCCLKVKKRGFFAKIDKNVQFNYLFLRISKMFIWVRVRPGGFFIWELKKVVHLKQCPLYSFCFRDAWKGSIEKTVNITRVCPSQQGLIIICKYCSLSHKPDHQCSSFKCIPICFAVSVI